MESHCTAELENAQPHKLLTPMIARSLHKGKLHIRVEEMTHILQYFETPRAMNVHLQVGPALSENA